MSLRFLFVAYLPVFFSSSFSTPPSPPPTPPPLAFPLQTFLLSSGDSAWKEVKEENKFNEDNKKKDGIFFPRVLSHYLTRQRTSTSSAPPPPTPHHAQFLFLSQTLSLINRMKYCRAPSEAKTDLDCLTNIFNLPLSFIH